MHYTCVMCETTSPWISLRLISPRSYIHLCDVMLNQRSPSSLREARNLRMNTVGYHRQFMGEHLAVTNAQALCNSWDHSHMIPPVLLCTTFDSGRHRLGGRHSCSDSRVLTHSFSMGPAIVRGAMSNIGVGISATKNWETNKASTTHLS